MKQYLAFSGLILLANMTFANSFHPDFLLKNGDGNRWHTGDTVSQAETCGQCHNTGFIHNTLDNQHRSPQKHTSLRQSLFPETASGEIGCLDCHAVPSTPPLETIANEQGMVPAKTLRLQSPTSEACGTCHGLVHTGRTPLSLENYLSENHRYGLTGEIFSAQKIDESALNIRGKESLSHSFDAHAERVLSCVDCHSSANNPVSPSARHNEKNLRFDPRKLSAHDYLYQPDHTFAPAHACESCHAVENTHNWLPYKNQHFNKLACESCHSNWIPSPAYARVDTNHTPIQVTWRGLEDKLIVGYKPWLLPNQHGKLAPFNIIEVQDQRKNITIAQPIHHAINKVKATRECLDCHNPTSQLFKILPATPANLTLPNNYIVDGKPQLDAAGLYVIGSNTYPLIDWIGLALVLLTLASASGHGLARFIHYRRRGPHQNHRQRVYMYTTYQRFWHWLQAALILLLIVTGAAIHKPWLFTWLSFSYMVEIHNILGFILVANAALALFYHLASGEIKQYMPMPDDFFVRSFEQIQFYIKGIFENAPHPFDKTPSQKLNPLQKIVYFGLLNVLLPAQVLSGIAMWGAQRWPNVSESIGGLTLLGPAHSLLAWSFMAFLIMHIYLTTTSGPKPLSGIKAMIDGWEDIETGRSSHHE